MNRSAENYVPQSLAVFFRKQAWKVWSIALFIAFSWIVLILLAPFFKNIGLNSAATPIYQFFSLICHQIPERSFHLFGHQFGVCSRCFGVYFGLFFGFVIYPFFRHIDEITPLPRLWLFAAMIPIGIDWLLGVLDIWENTHLSRFLTGGILGAVCAVFIIPALVEIARLNSTRKKRKIPD